MEKLNNRKSINDKDIIFAYTRKQAIEDGLQYELPKELTQQIYKYPVYITSGVYDLVQKAIENKKFMNDYEGVIWDILNMSLYSTKISETKQIFKVIITGVGRKRYHQLIVECGPKDIDNLEAVLTIMLPDEA